MVHVDAVAESGRNPVSKHQIQPEYEEAGLRDEMAKPLSQDHGSRRERVQGKIVSVQLLTSRRRNLTSIDLYSAESAYQTYILHFLRVIIARWLGGSHTSNPFPRDVKTTAFT